MDPGKFEINDNIFGTSSQRNFLETFSKKNLTRIPIIGELCNEIEVRKKTKFLSNSSGLGTCLKIKSLWGYCIEYKRKVHCLEYFFNRFRMDQSCRIFKNYKWKNFFVKEETYMYYFQKQLNFYLIAISTVHFFRTVPKTMLFGQRCRMLVLQVSWIYASSKHGNTLSYNYVCISFGKINTHFSCI